MKFFVKRPTVADEFRTCMNIPTSYSNAEVEQMVRKGLMAAGREQYGNKYAFVFEYVFEESQPIKLAALATHAKVDKDYDYVINHIKLYEDYESMRQELAKTPPVEGRKVRRNGSTNPPEVPVSTNSTNENVAIIRYTMPTDPAPRFVECKVSDLQARLIALLGQGIPETLIDVFKPVPWRIKVSIEDAA